MIITSAVDAYIDQDRQGANFGEASKLWLNGGGGSETCRALIGFARPFPLGVTVSSAILRLHTAEAWSGSQTLKARRITEAWKANRVNWNNRPSATSTNEGSVNAASLSAGAVIEIDITALMADVSAGADYFGLDLELSTDSNRALVSADSPVAERRPVLEIEWSEAPDAPTNLAPSGGRVVSATKPRLTWQFVDNAGSTAQASSRVQAPTSPDFSSPAYDSGKVANTLSAWNLAATAFTALTNGQTRYWRVMVWDETDLASAWSEAQEFTRENHGTLTLTAPAAAPDNYVEETTPPVSWTFTGRTQEAFEAKLYRVELSGALTQLAAQAKAVSGEVEWEVPAGILRSGDIYRVVLRVYDTLDRQAMELDPDYVEAFRDFTYQRSGAPAPVTGLTAEPDGARVNLAFSRSPMPDYFAVRRDGIEVLDRVEPSSVLVSGANYLLELWEAKPRVTHLYEIEAVVDNAGVLEHSDGNATASATTNPIGIWIADSEDSLSVFIAGKEKASMMIGQTAAIFDPIGSRSPVRVVDAVQGYEGSIAGTLTDFDGLTAKEWRDRFLELYGRLKPLRLILGDLNIPVEIGPVAALPASSGDRSYDVSMEFAQVGEFEEAFEVAGEA